MPIGFAKCLWVLCPNWPTLIQSRRALVLLSLVLSSKYLHFRRFELLKLLDQGIVLVIYVHHVPKQSRALGVQFDVLSLEPVEVSLGRGSLDCNRVRRHLDWESQADSGAVLTKCRRGGRSINLGQSPPKLRQRFGNFDGLLGLPDTHIDVEVLLRSVFVIVQSC